MKNIQQMANNRDITLSKMASKLIETGYKVKLLQDEKKNDKDADKMTELVGKSTEYLLRILDTTSDILRCVHNEKSKYKNKDFDAIIDEIREKMQQYIKGYIGKDQ